MTTLIHFLSAGVTYRPADGPESGPSEVARRGQTLEVTDVLVQRNTDRLGRCWIDLASDPDAQVQRWGRVCFAPGPFPDDESVTEPGSWEHADAAREARREASMLTDASERKAALRQVESDFGPGATTTSRTVREVSA